MSYHLLFSPLSWSVGFALLLALLWQWLPRTLCLLGLAIETALVLALTPFGANGVVRIIESRVPPAQTCKAPLPSTVVVLTGGLSRTPRSPEDFGAANLQSLHRLFAGVELWRRIPNGHLVISGGGRHEVTESVLLARLAQRLGVPADAVRAESRSLSTWQSARDVAALSPPVPRRIWLVSSKLHLPRALLAFRAAGFQPCAWSSESFYIPPSGSFFYYVPQSSSLLKMEAALHELVGGWAYAWRARHKNA
ncbi:MAG TPA: YdcF family protein [Rhodanobacteraceae bacterium]|nr:YdcF family protein [Rhodanobacteraceae bacterium]